MAARGFLILVAFATLVCASEVDDSEQKKRGAGKTTTLNAIPTGVQKPEYTYSIYSQNPSSQSLSYQPQQISNSFYPNQASQYYTSGSSPTDSQYPPQPQINLIPPQSSSQFLPLNFIQNGYQSKFQLLPSKSQNGNVQLALIPQTLQTPYTQQLFSPQPTHQQNLLGPLSHFNVAPNYQQFGAPYLGQPSTMLLFAQPNPSLYNNLLYPNPAQSFFNYYPNPQSQNSQYKYPSYVSQTSTDYERQGPVSQSVSKEDNDISAHTTNTEYLPPSESGSYKNAYSRSSSYSKV